MSFATEGNAIRSRFYALWSATPVAWPNDGFTPVIGTSYVRLSIRNGDSFQPYLGPQSKRRSVGVVFVEIYTEEERQDIKARSLADSVAAIFRNVQVSGITFREPSARESVTQEKGWYRWIVEVPYYRDWTPGEVDELASYPVRTVTQAAHGFVVGDWLTKPHDGPWAKARANASSTLSWPAVVTYVKDTSIFQVTLAGGKANVPAHGLGTQGTKLFLSQATAGLATSTEPTTGLVQQVGKVWDADHIEVMDFTPSNLS